MIIIKTIQEVSKSVIIVVVLIWFFILNGKKKRGSVSNFSKYKNLYLLIFNMFVPDKRKWSKQFLIYSTHLLLT